MNILRRLQKNIEEDILLGNVFDIKEISYTDGIFTIKIDWLYSYKSLIYTHDDIRTYMHNINMKRMLELHLPQHEFKIIDPHIFEEPFILTEMKTEISLSSITPIVELTYQNRLNYRTIRRPFLGGLEYANHISL